MKEPNFRSHYAVTKTQLAFVDKTTPNLDDGSRWVFCHILYCTFKVMERDGWIPVSWAATQRDKRTNGFNHEQLVRTGAVEYKEADYDRRLCREYKIKDFWLESFTRLGNPKTASVIDTQQSVEWFNVFTGKPINRRIGRKPKLITLPAGKSIAEEAAKTLSFCYLNNDALSHYENLTNPVYERILEDASSSGKHKGQVFGKYKNLNYCLNYIRATDADPTDKPGIYRIKTAYEVQDFGRLYLPLQHAPRVMKHFMYQETGLRNYDINACHARIVHHLLKSLKLPHRHLETYLTVDAAKAKTIEASGIGENAWKICFYALLNGAGLPPNLRFTRENNALRKTISIAVGKAYPSGEYSKFRKAVKPLYDEIFGWLKYIATDYINNPDNLTKGNGSRLYITNAANKKLDVTVIRDADKKVEEKARDLASFFLQGYESAFIHKLTLLGPQYGYIAVANEHDGLITIGEIPSKAVKEAETYAGIDNLVLKQKPFCSEGELEEWHRLVNS
jgi:hypothetical protein